MDSPDNSDNLHDIACKFYDIDNFNSNFDNVNELSILNFNIRSLSKNLDSFLFFLDSLTTKFDFIVLTETWTTNFDKDLFSIPGYKSFHFVRQGRSGGGVAIYVKDCYSVDKIDINFDDDADLEFVFVNVYFDKDNKNNYLTIGGIYRPPNSKSYEKQV